MTTPPLAITMGDASGVGPEILLRAFASGELGTDIVAVGDLAVLDLCNRRLQCGVTLDAVDRPAAGAAGRLHGPRRRGRVGGDAPDGQEEINGHRRGGARLRGAGDEARHRRREPRQS